MGRWLLCAALLCLVTWARSQPQYVLTTPVMLVSGDTAQACLNIDGITEPLNTIVVMNHDGRNTSIIAQDVAPSTKFFQCGEFKVPSVIEAVPVAIIFSATGSKTDLRERKSVVINSASNNCMYQMDKPIYKPGQKVQWRLLCLNSQLKPVDEKITSMYLQDPSRTKIAQWLKPASKNGVISMDFQLIPDATLGSYVITAQRESGYPISQWITVEKYVSPRFSVKLDCPQTVSMTDESVKFKVSAIYTYGEPVPGSVTVRYCTQPQYYGRRQNCFKDKDGSCANMTGELGADGTYSGVIDMYSAAMNSGARSFTLDATVTEAGTDIQATESSYVSVTKQPASLNLEYDSISQHYKRGLTYSVLAKLTDERGDAMPNKELDVQIDNGEVKKATTDSDGRIEYGIDTSNMVESNFTFKVSYTNPDQCYFSEWSEKDYPSVEYTVQRFYSFSGSFLHAKRPKKELICGQSHNIDVEYVISPDGTRTGVTTATFYYLVLSKSVIVHNGQKEVDLSGARNGTFSFDLPVTSKMAPSAKLAVYSILENEIISDTTNLDIEKCFSNRVSMTTSEEKVAPGSKVDVQISADRNSYCALRMIDSSLLILNPYEQFSVDRVINSRSFYSYDYNVAGFDLEDPAPPCEDPDKQMFHKGRYYVPVSSTAEGDAYDLFKSIGLVVGTNARLRRPEVCDKNPPQSPIVPLHPGGFSGGAGGVAKFASLEMDSASSGRAAPIETVRTDFADTILWIIVPVGTEGQATLSETMPDTITSWQGTAFCTSEETGFGMMRTPANITTFLPFFMELSTPYYCIRGETLVITTVAKNYMDTPSKASLTLANSEDFTATLKDGDQDVCVQPGGISSNTWELQPKIIGDMPITATAETSGSCDGQSDPSQPPRKDTVVQIVKVEPEGIAQERTSSNLVLVQNGKASMTISTTPPGEVVPDSSSASVTIVSDLFSIPLQNLENMVQKPTGCADQNLGRMAVIIPVLEYLNATGQLTEEILEKGKSYLTAGYQRLLSFHSGGAYKLFPNSREVNSVLTAESFQVLESASKYIFIDKDRQQQTLIWMENSQKLENGCFKSQGKPVTNQDGDMDVQYTASMAMALLASDYSLTHTLLEGALQCLKAASKSEQTISEEVLMLYVFTLAGLEEYRKPLAEKLMSKAKVEGGAMHWERPDMPVLPKGQYFIVYPAAEVWLTSYMVLSMARMPNGTPEDLTKLAQMSMWLVRQQNSQGGFSSTRDTAVGIKALAAVAQLFNTPDSRQTVAIKRDNGDVATVELTEESKLMVHREELPEARGDYLIDITGNGWCLIQHTVKYNIPVPKENSAYSFSISTSSENCINGVAHRFPLNCRLSYQGSHNESGMALVNIKMLSGYHADFSSLHKMKEDKMISRFEEAPKGEVLIYMEDVPKEPIDFTFHQIMGQRVLNVKSGSATVYSYYEETDNGYASYHHPCTVSTEDGGSTKGSSPAVGTKNVKRSGSRFGRWKPHGWSS